jgi:hypothetical protein
MFGEARSLNVAMCAGMAVSEGLRQTRWAIGKNRPYTISWYIVGLKPFREWLNGPYENDF